VDVPRMPSWLRGVAAGASARGGVVGRRWLRLSEAVVSSMTCLWITGDCRGFTGVTGVSVSFGLASSPGLICLVSCAYRTCTINDGSCRGLARVAVACAQGRSSWRRSRARGAGGGGALFATGRCLPCRVVGPRVAQVSAQANACLLGMPSTRTSALACRWGGSRQGFAQKDRPTLRAGSHNPSFFVK
jgi:hypothetical protein